MATNIEIQYYDGNTYLALRPMGDFTNMSGNLIATQIPNLDMSKITSGNLSSSRISGSLSANQIPNLDMGKITSGNLSGSRISGNVAGADYATNSGKLDGYTYSQVISNASSSGCKIASGSYRGTNTGTATIITAGISSGKVALITSFDAGKSEVLSIVNNSGAVIVGGSTSSTQANIGFNTQSYYAGATIYATYGVGITGQLNWGNCTYYYVAFGT